MRLPVYLYGHPVLRKSCSDIAPDREGLKELIENMYATMYDSEGVGLAGPQIGLAERIVVIDADPVKDSFPECEGRRFTLINPEVEVLDGDTVTYPPASAFRACQRTCRVWNIYACAGWTRISSLMKRRSQDSLPA